MKNVRLLIDRTASVRVNWVNLFGAGQAVVSEEQRMEEKNPRKSRMIAVSTKLTPEMNDRLDDIARKAMMPKSQIIRLLITQALESNTRQKTPVPLEELLPILASE